MKTIEVDERIYELLLHQTTRFGESPSEVIERLINGSASHPGSGRTRQHQEEVGPATQQKASPRTPQDPLGSFLNGPSFLVQGNAVGRFLAILSWLCNQHPQRFEEVLRLNGRKRKYFARSAEELEASGNSVMPKRIPDTPYWVVTNSPTQLKKQIIADVLRMLAYDPSSAHAVVVAIR
jgi:negative modulator of initiation of replication